MLCNEFPDTEVFWYKPLDNKPIGVGEALVSNVSRWLADYGITHEDILSHCDGTMKLGIGFEGWYREGENFLFPFGKGTETQAVCNAATTRKMMETGVVLPNLLDYYTVSTHIDVLKFTKYLDEQIMPQFNNLTVITELVESYDSIEPLYDILIDSTGFKQVLSKDRGNFIALESPGDSAYTYRTPYTNIDTQQKPYTKVIAQPRGWVWNIPLKHERTYGYIHNKSIGTKEDFVQYLKTEIGEVDESKIGQVFWRVGIEEKPLIDKKLFTTGLASGFLEPLQSTGIYLMTRTLDGIQMYLKGVKTLEEANEYITTEMLAIYEFIKAHYKYSNRPEDYWNSFNNLEVEDYKSTGAYPDDKNWSYLLEGMHLDFRDNTLGVDYDELIRLHKEGVPYKDLLAKYR
jgi:tryptophan halogenase